MPTLQLQDIALYYETHGSPAHAPVLLISGLGGTGKSWSTQVERFARDYFVVVPDHRGTGQSSRTLEGHSTEQLAADMDALVDHLGMGPMHVVGASTGGAIAQHMALRHSHTVRSLVLSSTFARFDAFMQRQFAVRRKMAETWDRTTLLSAYSLFLFSPRFTREHPERVAAWITHAAAAPSQPQDSAIALQRIDMIAAHDTLPRLAEIRQPTLVLCGDRNLCTPLPLSEELVHGIPGAELQVFADAGELIEIEQAEAYFSRVDSFLRST